MLVSLLPLFAVLVGLVAAVPPPDATATSASMGKINKHIPRDTALSGNALSDIDAVALESSTDATVLNGDPLCQHGQLKCKHYMWGCKCIHWEPPKDEDNDKRSVRATESKRSNEEIEDRALPPCPKKPIKGYYRPCRMVKDSFTEGRRLDGPFHPRDDEPQVEERDLPPCPKKAIRGNRVPCRMVEGSFSEGRGLDGPLHPRIDEDELEDTPPQDESEIVERGDDKEDPLRIIVRTDNITHPPIDESDYCSVAESGVVFGKKTDPPCQPEGLEWCRASKDATSILNAPCYAYDFNHHGKGGGRRKCNRPGHRNQPCGHHKTPSAV